jgi:flavin-dependent dehydrogenase
MKIAIAGAGIAGSYLAQLLQQNGLSPDVYDAMEHESRCGSRSCGWGVPAGIERYLGDVGLELNDYFLEPMSLMNFDNLVAKTPLLTVDKPRLIRDFTLGITLKGQNLGMEEAEDYDILVDATGIARALLPPCRSDLTLPTLQHRVTVEPRGSRRLEAGVYGKQVPGLGYIWVFPLGRNLYHIGIGGIGLVSLESLMDRFYQDLSGIFEFTPICSCRGNIRVASPYYSTPLYRERTREDGRTQLIVGVGESIGTVAPFTGEGIVHSLESARIFAESWQDPGAYAKSVLARFSWMKKERETLDYLLEQRGKGSPRVRDRWRFFRSARRSGIGLPMLEGPLVSLKYPKLLSHLGHDQNDSPYQMGLV